MPNRPESIATDIVSPAAPGHPHPIRRPILSALPGLFYVFLIGQFILAASSMMFVLWPGSTWITKLKPVPTSGKTWADLPLPAYSGVLLVERSVEELTLISERIIAGHVLSVKARRTATSIETDVTLAVDQVIKGSVQPQETLTFPGGQVGDETLMVGGIPNFLAGEHVVLFLDDDSQFVLAGMWQGKYSLSGDQALQPENHSRTSIDAISEQIGLALTQPVQINSAPELIHAEYTQFCPAWRSSVAPVVHHVNPANSGSNAPTGAAFVRLAYDSLNAWQALPNAWIALQIGGLTTRDGKDHTDGNNDIVWGDLDSSTLGVNTCMTLSGQRIDSDTVLDNSNTTWSVLAEANKIDLRAVLEHELGHGIGLGHSNQTCNGFATTPLMCPAVANGQRKTILTDDSDGAAALYSLSGTPPTAPVALAALGGASSVTLKWSDTATGELAFEVQRAAGSCTSSFKAILTAIANAVTVLDDEYGFGLPAGTYCYRVKALGTGGDSGFSNPVSVVVGAVTSPTTSSTVIPTATHTVTPTATHTVTPTATRTVTPTATRTVTPTATRTGTPPTATRTITPTATRTITPTATKSITPGIRKAFMPVITR